MSILEIVTLLGGVALFLFGMTKMGDGLTKLSGSSLEPILYRLSGTPMKALLLGTGVTAVIQSSSATSVMAVGFVNSGMMTVRQSVHVILGAILGTSITGWVICLSYLEGGSGISSILSTSTLTGIVAFAGMVFRMNRKNERNMHIGDILMGFAILMFGMHTMSGAVSGLGEQPWFTNMMLSMSHPLLGILVGTAITAVLQSASAAVGILQALSVTGALQFDAALPLLMGINIGAALPVLLSAVGATTKGKRAASVYLVEAILGVLGCAALFYVANALFHFKMMENVMNPFSTAMLNTLFRLANLLLIAPLADVVEAVVTRAIPETETKEQAPELQLEERFLAHPALALEQSRIQINEMASKAQTSFRLAVRLLREYDEETFQRVRQLEEEVDRYEDLLGSYMLQLSGQKLTEKQSEEVSKCLRTLSDFERISDHARNIAESSAELHQKLLFFSAGGTHDLSVLIRAVTDILKLAVEAYRTDDAALAEKVEPLEEVIDFLCDEIKMRQVERLQHGQGNILQNFVFNDLITNLERIADHCSNLGLAVVRMDEGDFETHQYQESLQEGADPEFSPLFLQYRKEYAL
ncbi:MAG: Na/Pi cotransporter family protein [Oscillospiraceae bacterium]|nr:Na/Pi cotransporter family protein [Oscillospiraceae bacterium]